MKSFSYTNRIGAHDNKPGLLLPVCASCKKIRKPGANPKIQESWIQAESYLNMTYNKLTHSICPACIRKHYPEVALFDE
jgi:hypothetical protein